MKRITALIIAIIFCITPNSVFAKTSDVEYNSVPYEINYLLENVDGKYYTEDTITGTGRYATKITVPQKEFPHYSCKTRVKSFVIDDTSGKVVDIYYALDTYTITYKDSSNGKMFSPAQFTARYGERTPQYIPPVVSGYVFDRWYPSISNTVTENMTYTADYIKPTPAPIKFKAAPRKEYCMLYFETFGGSTYPPEKHKRDVPILLTIFPKKQGYVFAGWYKDPEFTIPILSAIYLTGDTTIYAKYVPTPLN